MDKAILDKYEAVIGLEIHAQMLTKSKAYSSDVNAYGAAPNSNVSPITLGHPGTLPWVNQQHIQNAISIGLCCNSTITKENRFDRKNYFYADMPKGYQITQDKTPICQGGSVTITVNGEDKEVGVTRIHMEEDSGKSIHDQDPFNTLVDLNRAGVPLLEIVSEPDMRTGDEAYAYVTEVRKLVRYLEICDGNMEEGSLRCDANISVRLKGQSEFGTKVEVKNMNSISNVKRAINHEIERQIERVENNEPIAQETRSFDAGTGTTISMRSKEDANDYRYFPEPDLPLYMVSDEQIDKVKSTLPALPRALFKKYTQELGLPEYDAYLITDSKPLAAYFEEIISHTANSKAASNWVMTDIKGYLNKSGIDIQDFPIAAKTIAQLIQLVDDKKVSQTVASQKLFPALIENPDVNPLHIAEKNNWIQESNTDALDGFVTEALAKYPEKVAEYQSGKKGLIGLFMGEVMKLSRGKADPKVANELLKRKLES